ncbi:TPA: DUF927 domain-containing protein [Salmonella enterica subsp. diarizonae serovar 61:r:-]
MALIRYSRGTKRATKTVEQCNSASEDAFIDGILADVAGAKYQQFFCAPVRKGTHPKGAKDPGYQGEKYWRLSAHVEPWRVARFDCDSFDSPRTFNELKTYLNRFKGFLYTTTNYTASAPRCRFVVLLNAEVNRDEGKRVCEGIAAEIDAHMKALADDDLIGDWTPVIGWDNAVYLAEQQCYMPVADPTGTLKTKSGEPITPAISVRFNGELADVAHYLALVPETPKRDRNRDKGKPLPSDDDPATSDAFCQFEGIDKNTMDDLRSALHSPGMLRISAGPRKPWQSVIAALCYLKETPLEDAAYKLAREWSEAGGLAFEEQAFEDVWATSRADVTSYKAIFTEAQRLGWTNPQILRPYVELEKAGFYMTGDGLMENISAGAKSDADFTARKISACFYNLGQTRDADSGNWGQLLAFKDRDGCYKRFIVPDAELHKQGSDIPRQLAADGLWINTDMGKRLLAYLNIVRSPKRITCTPSTGWCGENAFVLSDGAVGPGAEKVIFQHTGRVKHHTGQAGTLDEWKQSIAAPVAGNSRLIFAVCVALAAPLMSPAGLEGGVFSLLGVSTKGKSTAQRVAASVWGKGTTDGGYVGTWNATETAVEMLAAAHNDMPLILDELKAASPKLVGRVAHTLAAGQGKARGTKEITLRENFRWRTLVLASSEKPFESFLHAAGEIVEAGQQARFVDVPAIVNEITGVFDNLHGVPVSTENAKAFADNLSRAAVRYYGTAGRAWLNYLTAAGFGQINLLVGELRDTFRQQYRPDDAGSQLDRVLERFTICAVAGELATRAGVTGWQTGEALAGVGACFTAYVEQRGTLRDMEGVNGVEHLKRYLSDYGRSRFVRHSGDKTTVHDGYVATVSGGKVIESDDFNNLTIPETQPDTGVEVHYWIFSEAMDRILEGHNLMSTIASMEESGALITGEARKKEPGRLTPKGRVANPRGYDPVDRNRRRYYRINGNMLFS